MLQVKFKRLWWACLIAIAASYPLSVMAADELGLSQLSPPFVVAWIGVWVFAIAGGVGASFIHITDVDSKLRYPALAKIVLGTFWGMALSLAIESLTSTPMGALPLFALGASCFSAPLCAGFMVYISSQKRQNDVYDIVKDKATMRVFGRKAKRGENETDTL
ncbi:hypothetical protein [Psychrobacter alimentarius]|uniref:hypothetical protein n=1 Tax=Psychrobacter alimentarius TaxID=261164 RepID=UPI00103FC2BA